MSKEADDRMAAGVARSAQYYRDHQDEPWLTREPEDFSQDDAEWDAHWKECDEKLEDDRERAADMNAVLRDIGSWT